MAIGETGAGASGKAFHRVAIAPLVNAGSPAEQNWIGEGTAATVSGKLAAVPTLTVVDRLELRHMMEKYGLRPGSLAKASVASRLGEVVGADRILVGTYVRKGDDIHFDVRVLDVTSGLVVSDAKFHTARQRIFDAFFRLAAVVLVAFDSKTEVVNGRSVVVAAPKPERILVSTKQYESIRTWGATSPEAFEALAQGLASEQYDDQIRWFSKAIALDGKYAPAWNQRGIVWSLKNEPHRAMADFTEAIKIDRTFAEAYRNRGVIFGENGEYDRAVRHFTAAIKLRPAYPVAYLNRGGSWRRKGEYDKAVADYTAAIEINPDYAVAYFSRGFLWARRGNGKKAIADYTSAIEADGRFVQAYCNRSVVWIGLGEQDRAIADCAKAIRIDPTSAEAYCNRGLAWQHKGDNDRAIADQNRAIELDPEFARAYGNRGIAWGEKGELDKAIRDFDAAIRLNPNSSEPYLNRAVAYYMKREFEKSWADVEACRKLGRSVDPKLVTALSKARGRGK